MPEAFTVTGGPITNNGTLAVAVSGTGTAGQYLDYQGNWTTPSKGVETINFGTTGLTPNSATDGAVTVAGTLTIANGGTGQTTRQAAIDSLTNAAAADTGYVLTSDGTNANYEQINVSNVAGTLAVGNGGTGATTLTSGGILKGNGTSAITANGDINDLTSASFDTSPNGSLYIGSIPTGLVGTPAANLAIGGGAAKLLSTGTSNVTIGNKAGDILTTGIGNTIIGAGADSAAAGNDSGIAIGEGTIVGDAGIAIGRRANAGNNELAIGSSSYAITLDATSRSAGTFLPIKVNGTQYYIQLYVA